MTSTFVILRSGISGGTATLSIRIGDWLVSHRYEVLYICQEFNDLNNVKSMQDKGINVYKWELNDIANNLSNLYGGCSFVFLTYSLDEFLFVERLKRKIPIKKNTLYVVHNYELLRASKQNVIIRKPVAFFYKTIIRKLITNGNILFMDNKSVDITEEYYGVKIGTNDVFRLPISANPYQLEKVNKKSSLNSFNLLTIARANFPFKGYVLGLIDDFQKLYDTYKHLTLTIITFGKDENQINEKMQSLPNEVKSKITQLGQTPYEKLAEYFDQAHLCLGMGTTVLDAVNHSVPALLVQDYTYHNLSSGFFHMQPDLLVGKKGINIPAIDFIESVITMDKDEYAQLCSTEHNTLMEYYNIDSFINRIKYNRDENYQKGISKIELFVHKFIMKIASIITKYK